MVRGVLCLRFGGLILVGLVLGCGMRKDQDSGGGSTLTIQLPSRSQGRALASHMNAASVDNVCFVINVTASDIGSSVASSCDIPAGIFAGSFGVGSTISVTVPNGVNRRLEMFGFTKSVSGGACPALANGFGSVDRGSIMRIGSVPSFNTTAAEVTLNVTVSLPDGSTNLVSQYGLAASCNQTATNNSSAARIWAGLGTTSGGGKVIKAGISERGTSQDLQGGSYVIRLKRASN